MMDYGLLLSFMITGLETNSLVIYFIVHFCTIPPDLKKIVSGSQETRRPQPDELTHARRWLLS